MQIHSNASSVFSHEVDELVIGIQNALCYLLYQNV